MKIRRIFHSGLAFIFLFNVCGCATPKAIEYAEKKASRPSDYRKITKIHPIAFRKKENIKLCVTLTCYSADCNNDNYLVSFPFDSLASGKTNPKIMGFRLNPFIIPKDPYYFFPIKKHSKECADSTALENHTKLVVNEISVPYYVFQQYEVGNIPKDTFEFFATLDKYSECEISEGNVYILKNDISNYYEKILLYIPEKDKNLKVFALGLGGGYQTTGTNDGYALVPLAIVADIAIVALLGALVIVIVIACIINPAHCF